MASAFSTTPPTISSTRSHITSGSASTLSVASATSPTTKEFAIVPRPGRSRSGIQNSSTTRLITITAVPMLIGRCSAIPWWSTSHEALPSVPRISIASVTPYSTSPTVS